LKALMAPGAPSEAGSGKLKTPCERMHLAYSTSSPPEDEPPTTPAAFGTTVVVVLRLATRAVRRPPPQAAVTRTRPITPGATKARRRRAGPAITGRLGADRNRALLAPAVLTLRVYTKRVRPRNNHDNFRPSRPPPVPV
jgi:hypothetical protein